jgi:hypothetical protein
MAWVGRASNDSVVTLNLAMMRGQGVFDSAQRTRNA